MSNLKEQLTGSLALIDQQPAMPVVSNESLRIVQLAIQLGAPIETVERLLAMKERVEADEARKKFNAAFAAFKGEAVKIIRTKQITDGPLKGKRHAELGVIVSTVTPALSAHGLSISWRMTKDEKDWMEVCCTLRHVDGHSESVTMGGAPDTGPGRNAIQARGSAKTYLERYTATAILGLAPEDEDNDGAGAGEAISQEQGSEWVAAIEGSRTPEEVMKNWTAATASAKKINDFKAMTIFTEARDRILLEMKRGHK